MQDYASTLAFALLHKKSGTVIIYSLGDSTAIIGSTNGTETVCRQESRNKPICTTATENGYTKAHISRHTLKKNDTVLLLTDGGAEAAEEIIANGSFTDEEILINAFETASVSDDHSFISMNCN